MKSNKWVNMALYSLSNKEIITDTFLWKQYNWIYFFFYGVNKVVQRGRRSDNGRINTNI